MQDTAKYLIHAHITADGIVERSDVVGAVFGQTEGLLGDELDLRDLQESSKVGRIDVEVDSEGGQSFGELTIATSLDKVETAILAAALETIDRIGPCRSTIEVDRIEDVRAAKRREVVERAKTLLAEAYDGSVMSSRELVEEVRRSIRVEDITEYEGYPAGPRVADSDAIIVVEGRSDVLTLLRYGIKNAIAVEGTNVPDPVAELTRGRTVTAFLDGDRGGDLILKELAQVGDVDYVAFAPEDRAVEELARHEVMTALREKVPYEMVAGESAPSEVAATDGSVRPAPPAADSPSPEPASTPEPTRPTDATPDAGVEPAIRPVEPATETADDDPGASMAPGEEADDAGGDTGSAADELGDDADEEATEPEEPETLRGHARQVDGSGTARLLDADFRTLGEGPAGDAFDLVDDAEAAPAAVVLDGELTQRVLDVAAQRGVEQIVARSEGEFVKRPASVRVRTTDQLS